MRKRKYKYIKQKHDKKIEIPIFPVKNRAKPSTSQRLGSRVTTLHSIYAHSLPARALCHLATQRVKNMTTLHPCIIQKTTNLVVDFSNSHLTFLI